MQADSRKLRGLTSAPWKSTVAQSMQRRSSECLYMWFFDYMSGIGCACDRRRSKDPFSHSIYIRIQGRPDRARSRAWS